MNKILALIWILLLCLGLLIFSFLYDTADSHAQLPQDSNITDPTTRTATPDMATPDLPPQSTPDTPTFPEERLRLTFLNGQPVLQLLYDQLADEFFEKTGIRVQTVSSESNLEGVPPVLFSVNNAQELEDRSCLDLSDTVAYANLSSSDFTLIREDQVVGIASEAEPFGLIVNSGLLAQVGYTGTDIDSFADLKAVAEHITRNQQELGFGAFEIPTETGSFGTLLAAVPTQIRSFWELYTANGAGGDVYSGKAVFCLGTLSEMKRLSAGGTLQLEMLPLFTGSEAESSQALHCYGRHYWCVRGDAAPEEIEAALAFLNFLVSPRTDGRVPVDDLAILAPYRQATYARTEVERRFRSDIAQGKTCIVCSSECPVADGYTQALLTFAATPTDENWQTAEALRTAH